MLHPPEVARKRGSLAYSAPCSGIGRSNQRRTGCSRCASRRRFESSRHTDTAAPRFTSRRTRRRCRESCVSSVSRHIAGEADGGRSRGNRPFRIQTSSCSLHQRIPTMSGWPTGLPLGEWVSRKLLWKVQGRVWRSGTL